MPTRSGFCNVMLTLDMHVVTKEERQKSVFPTQHKDLIGETHTG